MNIPRTHTRPTLRRLALGLAALAVSGAASAASYSTLLTITNQNWNKPPWAEVTIEDDDSQGAGGIRFTVNLCDADSPMCPAGYVSPDYTGGQHTIEQFGFNFSGSLGSSNLVGAPGGWTLDSESTMDGFGKFLYSVGNGAQSDTTEPLVFWILADGDSILDYASIGSTGGQPNAGSLFSVKVAASRSGAFIGGGTPATVPLPGTLGLLGIGVAALGAVRRRS